MDPKALAEYLQRAYGMQPDAAFQYAQGIVGDTASKAYQGLQAEMQQAFAATPQSQDKQLSEYQQYYQMLQKEKQIKAGPVTKGRLNAKGECTCQ